MIGILAGTATLSIAVQAAALIAPLRRMGFRYRPAVGVARPRVRRGPRRRQVDARLDRRQPARASSSPPGC